MLTPGTYPIVVYRWTPAYIVLTFKGLDFTDAVCRAQVRAYPDASGSALLDLTMQTAGTEGISLDVYDVDGLDYTDVTLQIDEDTIEALLPFPANGTEAGEGVGLSWDLHITPDGGTKARWLEGSFTIKPGVTQS